MATVSTRAGSSTPKYRSEVSRPPGGEQVRRDDGERQQGVGGVGRHRQRRQPGDAGDPPRCRRPRGEGGEHRQQPGGQGHRVDLDLGGEPPEPIGSRQEPGTEQRRPGGEAQPQPEQEELQGDGGGGEKGVANGRHQLGVLGQTGRPDGEVGAVHDGDEGDVTGGAVAGGALLDLVGELVAVIRLGSIGRCGEHEQDGECREEDRRHQPRTRPVSATGRVGARLRPSGAGLRPHRGPTRRRSAQRRRCGPA